MLDKIKERLSFLNKLEIKLNDSQKTEYKLGALDRIKSEQDFLILLLNEENRNK